MLPAAQKAGDSLGRPQPPGIVEPLRAAAGEGPQDAQKGSAQPSCSVKEEPDADGQEMGKSGGRTCLGVCWWSVDVPSWDGDPGGTTDCTAGPCEAGTKCWLTECHVAGTHSGLLPAVRGGPQLQHPSQYQLICPGSQVCLLTPDPCLPHFLAPASPLNPVQSQEGPVGHGEPDSASFHPPRIQVSSLRWGGECPWWSLCLAVFQAPRPAILVLFAAQIGVGTRVPCRSWGTGTDWRSL